MKRALVICGGGSKGAFAVGGLNTIIKLSVGVRTDRNGIIKIIKNKL